MAQLTYKDAGVDLGLYAEAMDKLPALMQRTRTGRVIDLVGGFAGLFRLNDPTAAPARRYKDPVLVSGTDGAGTKVKIAASLGRFSTIGIDLVAMCVNDVLCLGAEPLFFLDYVAMDRDDPGAWPSSSTACRTAVWKRGWLCSAGRRPSCRASTVPAISTWPASASASSNGRKSLTARPFGRATNSSAWHRAAFIPTDTA